MATKVCKGTRASLWSRRLLGLV